MVGLSVRFLFFSIGNGDFFNSFFHTIHYHLERGEWGSRYPLVLKNLYMGEVPYDKLSELEEELIDIKNRLKSIPPSQIIWDIEDLNKKPPWGNDISRDITDLSNYFVTSAGNDLFKVLFDAVVKAKELVSNIKVKSTFQRG